MEYNAIRFYLNVPLFQLRGWVTKTRKRLLSFLMYCKTVFESVQKKICFTFSFASSVNLFLIWTAVTATCNSSFGIDVFLFKETSLLLHIANYTFTEFLSVIFWKCTTHPNATTFFHFLESQNNKTVELQFYKRS